jgi:uncharacterized repeat protein (TIGR03803 family)
MLTNILPEQLSRICLQAIRATLTVAVVIGLGAAATQAAQAQTFTVLHNFTGKPDGSSPQAGLVRDAEGNLYGTTPSGGASNVGTIFKVDSSGNETVLHSFNVEDGEFPIGGVLRDASGNLYGTTQQGGARQCGTIFRFNANGTLTELHDFGGADGCAPEAGLTQDAQGNLYGTTTNGGSSGYGTVFKLSKSGKETVLHSFVGGTKDGLWPYAGVILDDEGNLYGDTSSGGASDYGIVYKLSQSGKLTILHSFTGFITDGCVPDGLLVMDKSGDLFGTTSACGSSGYGEGDGVVFKIVRNKTEFLLYKFTGGSDGGVPYAGVVRDSAGNSYGTTLYGGTEGTGTVFKLDANGTQTVLHNFSRGSDGGVPYGGVALDAQGNLYGTTIYGGSSQQGTVWQLTP